MVELSTLLLILGCFRIDNVWNIFREGSCSPWILFPSQLPNRVWYWNFPFDKRWKLVWWSCYWCVFQKLKSNFLRLRTWKITSVMCVTISPFTCSLGGTKNFTGRLTALQRVLLINKLKCLIGVALILKCFWLIFVPGEANFHFNTNIKILFLHIWSKSIKIT